MFYPYKALSYFQNHLFYLPKTPFPLIRYGRPRRYRQSIAVKYGGGAAAQAYCERPDGSCAENVPDRPTIIIAYIREKYKT